METIEDIKRMRDEIKLKSHLLKMDTKKRWEELEQNWQKLSAEYDPKKKVHTKEAMKRTSEDIRSAGKLLLEEIRDGYKRISESLNK